ncbi:MAG TPA: response regulator [Sphingobium sp.]|nr:response regulator [Sphingobium sp.]
MAGVQGRILLIEDDPALASRVVDLLLKADYQVDGPYASASDGVAAIASGFPDGAVLDLHHPSTGAGLLKEDLEAYDIPFLDCGALSAEKPRDLESRLLPWLAEVRH